MPKKLTLQHFALALLTAGQFATHGAFAVGDSAEKNIKSAGTAPSCSVPIWAKNASIKLITHPSVTCADVDRVFQSFADLNEKFVVPAGLVTPSHFLLNLLSFWDSSNFNGYQLFLALRVRWRLMEPSFQKTIPETVPVMMHEYAHVVFSVSLAKDIPEFRRMFQAQQIYGARWYEFVYLKNDMENPKYREALAAFLKFDGPYSASLAYHEFFADLFAVNATGDGDAIERALTFENSAQTPVRASFIQPYPLKGWKETEPHVLLNPTRSFVWSRYLSPSSQCSLSPQEKLKVSYVVLKEQIEKIFTEHRSHPSDGDVEGLNRELMDAFEKAFRQAGC